MWIIKSADFSIYLLGSGIKQKGDEGTVGHREVGQVLNLRPRAIGDHAAGTEMIGVIVEDAGRTQRL